MKLLYTSGIAVKKISDLKNPGAAWAGNGVSGAMYPDSPPLF
ncbi:hypothetical protein [Noviherbaspirillum sp.]